jgi:hypothetical protein
MRISVTSITVKLLLAIAGPSLSNTLSTAQAGHCEGQTPDDTPLTAYVVPMGNSVIGMGIT